MIALMSTAMYCQGFVERSWCTNESTLHFLRSGTLFAREMAWDSGVGCFSWMLKVWHSFRQEWRFQSWIAHFTVNVSIIRNKHGSQANYHGLFLFLLVPEILLESNSVFSTDSTVFETTSKMMCKGNLRHAVKTHHSNSFTCVFAHTHTYQPNYRRTNSFHVHIIPTSTTLHFIICHYILLHCIRLHCTTPHYIKYICTVQTHRNLEPQT